MANNSNEARNRAGAAFKKEQRAKEGEKAASEYEADAIAVRKKTERLKALRLARDAAGIPAPTVAPAAPKKQKKAAKTKEKPLAEWLEGQKGDGREG